MGIEIVTVVSVVLNVLFSVVGLGLAIEWCSSRADAPKKKESALRIFYKYPGDTEVRKQTYVVECGEGVTLWENTIHRGFLRWWFGRVDRHGIPDSTYYIVRTANGDKREWRREHILHVEVIEDLKKEKQR